MEHALFHPSLSYVRIMEFLDWRKVSISSHIHIVVPYASHSQSTLWTPQPTPLSDSHLKLLEFHHHSPCSSLASSSSLVSPPRIKVLAAGETIHSHNIYIPDSSFPKVPVLDIVLLLRVKVPAALLFLTKHPSVLAQESLLSKSELVVMPLTSYR